jgi:hypothetical protein
MDAGQWTPASRQGYNLRDAIARYTLQVLIMHSLSVVHRIFLKLQVPRYIVTIPESCSDSCLK